MVTAGRAREIALTVELEHEFIKGTCIHCGLRYRDVVRPQLEQPCPTRFGRILIDTAIETLEAWRTEHRSIRTHWMEYGKSDDCHECVAMQRQLTRLRAEREQLESRAIAPVKGS